LLRLALGLSFFKIGDSVLVHFSDSREGPDILGILIDRSDDFVDCG
jgi:hypothetical protein